MALTSFILQTGNKQSLENYLFLNRVIKNRKYPVLIGYFLICNILARSQSIGNYVNNGSFESYFVSFIYKVPYYWGATDSLKSYGELLTNPGKVPTSGYTYQWPHSGKNHLITNPYSHFSNNNRGYPRNRLKGVLKAGHNYCVSMYVNLSDQSTHGIDAIGLYFGNNTLDTIKKCTDPITYLVPQVQNPVGNIIKDTMNWVPITGTFVANGTEKYLLIGNFRSNATTNTVLTNPTNLPANFAEYLIDDVSVIEMDLAAYAGRDTSIAPGDSAFIGRVPDFAIDPGCHWYSLPGMVPIDTISGMWVKPTTTTTYVVKQILDCSTEKWDTVVVYMNLVGLEKLKAIQNDLRIYPVPAKDYVELSSAKREWLEDFKYLTIYNNMGQLIRQEELRYENKRLHVRTDDLPDGIYSLEIRNATNETLFKKLVVAR